MTDKERCLICKESEEERRLDFHHWDYEQGIGIRICRNCHEAIHGGKRKTHQDNKAKWYGFEGWLEPAVKRLITRDIAYTEPAEFDIEQNSWQRYWQRITEKYNLNDVETPDMKRVEDWVRVKEGVMKQGKPGLWGER